MWVLPYIRRTPIYGAPYIGVPYIEAPLYIYISIYRGRPIQRTNCRDVPLYKGPPVYEYPT